MLKLNYRLKNRGLLKGSCSRYLVDGTRLFHCGEIKLNKCHPELVSAFQAERTAKYPLLEERDRVRCLTEQEKSEILRSSSADLLQSDGLSLRMTNEFDNHNKCRHPERSEGSLAGGLRITPSPREEGVGERVFPFAKIKPLKRIMQKSAFTLAEVLITLGIIGVVAAITIPSLVTNYQKHVVETKLARFNSTMNQAMRLSMADNGDPDSWVERYHTYSYAETLEFVNTYFLPYMNILKMQSNSIKNGLDIILLDGSMFQFSIDVDGADIIYYINGKREINSRNSFSFQFSKRIDWSTKEVNSSNFIEPYILNWDGNISHLTSSGIFRACKKGCTNCGYCTKLIQLNGWKIPKDYPW